MSGLVFVQDAHARPLMPTSAAYARTLQRQGKAQFQPHPAFTVLRLTRTVPQPVLRPILIGVTLQRSIAHLVILIDEARAHLSSTHVVVDIGRNSPRAERRGAQPRWRTNDQHRSICLPVNTRARHTGQLLLDVLAALQLVLPVSHLVFLPVSNSSITSSQVHEKIVNLISRRLPLMPDRIAIFDLVQLPPTGVIYQLTQTLIHHMAHGKVRSPQVVACSLNRLNIVWPRRLPPKQLRSGSRPNVGRYRQVPFPQMTDKWGQGRLGTIRLNGRQFTGVIYISRRRQRITLNVPVAVNMLGIVWQQRHVPIGTPVHIWTTTSVALLPVRGI